MVSLLAYRSNFKYHYIIILHFQFTKVPFNWFLIKDCNHILIFELKLKLQNYVKSLIEWRSRILIRLNMYRVFICLYTHTLFICNLTIQHLFYSAKKVLHFYLLKSMNNSQFTSRKQSLDLGTQLSDKKIRIRISRSSVIRAVNFRMRYP